MAFAGCCQADRNSLCCAVAVPAWVACHLAHDRLRKRALLLRRNLAWHSTEPEHDYVLSGSRTSIYNTRATALDQSQPHVPCRTGARA